MGSKNNPGEFDCYHKAYPEEPMFILLGRDPHAAAAVRKWADDREQMIYARLRPATDIYKVVEARKCANDMENFLFQYERNERVK